MRSESGKNNSSLMSQVDDKDRSNRIILLLSQLHLQEAGFEVEQLGLQWKL